MNLYKKVIPFFLFCTSVIVANAQKENSLWLFGTSGGLQFDAAGTPTVVSSFNRNNYGGSPPYAEGCGIAINPKSGRMLFCTDGETVYKESGTVMDGGTNIGGINANNCMQAVAIAPMDCNYRKFYIFINTANSHGGSAVPGMIQYRIVDLDGNAGQGQVLPANNNVIYTMGDESMAVYFNKTTSQHFLVYKKIDVNDFFVCKLTDNPADIATNTTKYTIPYPAGITKVDAHAFKFSSTLGKIAFGAWSPTKHVFTVDFDINSGAISNWQIIDNNNVNAIANAQTSIVYDCEWSPDGTKLYTAQLGATVIYQYDFNKTPITRTTVYTDPAPALTAQAGGMKTGPDGKIYYRYSIATQLIHRIDNPNGVGTLCDFKQNVLTLNAGAVDAYLFPVTCEYEDTISTVAVIGATNICVGDSVRLEATGGKSYEWSTGESSSFIYAKKSGNYYTVTTFPSGCTHTSNVINITAVTPTKANAGADKGVPCGSTTTLMAVAPPTGSYSYQWIGGPATQNYPNVGAGTYVLQMTDNATSCKSYDTVLVQNTAQSFTISGLPTDTMVCINSTLNLNAIITPANGTYTHSWTDDKGNTYPATTNLSTSISQNMVFTYIVNDGACSDSRIINVTTTDAKAKITVNGSTTLCAGDSVQLTVPTGGTYLWSNGKTTRSIHASKGGNYFCTRSIGACKANTDTVAVMDASFTTSITLSSNAVDSNETVNFSGSNTSLTYAWDFGDGTTAMGTSTSHAYSRSGNYVVSTTITNGTCTEVVQNAVAVGSAVVAVNTDLQLYLPSVFEPNSAGPYNTYKADPRGSTEFLMGIFNRWGAAVFYTNTPLYTWDGKDLDGKECPEGTYAIIAQAKNEKGETVTKTGTVYLLKR